MGGAAGNSQRSSSPLKRRASDLEEAEVAANSEDVEMKNVPSVDGGSVEVASEVRPKPQEEATRDGATQSREKSAKAENKVKSATGMFTLYGSHPQN